MYIIILSVSGCIFNDIAIYTESFSSKKVEVIKVDHGEFENFSPPQILGRDRKISNNIRST